MLLPPVALTNCARPVGYEQGESDAGVIIVPENFSGRECPDPSGFLREDVKTGEVVRIDTCVPDGGAYLDACVGPGTYRYGFAKPYECASSACSTDYFTEVTVTTPEAPGCKVHAKVEHVPWGSNPRICSYGSRLAVMGLGFLAVCALFLGAILYAVVRYVRRKRAERAAKMFE